MTSSTFPIACAAPAGRIAQIVHVVLTAGVCAVLGFGPLAFGAVQPWSIFVLELTVSVLFLIWAAGGLASKSLRVAPNPLYVPVVLFAVVVLAQLLFHLSAYWYATWTKGLLYASYAGLLFLVSQVFREKHSVSVFVYFCTGYGFLISLFAIIQQFTSNGKIYWTISNRHGGWIYGPYVNHAHYSGLMEMLVPFPLVLALTLRIDRSARAFFLFVALVMSSTIFLSESLGGIIAFSAEVVILFWIMFRRRSSFSARGIVLLSLLCISLLIWLAWLRPPGLLDRIARLLNPISDAGATGRTAIVRDSLRMLRLRPLLGWGLGTFSVVYPSFRSFFTNSWVNEAHNDLVQTVVEGGTAGFAIAAAFVAQLFRGAIYNLRSQHDDTRSCAVLAAFLGSIGILLHGLVDFNLQIPANAAFFFALSAIATTRSDELRAKHEIGR